MRFGQLQIFRPDGPVETVILDGDTLGIGRSPGNFLVLDRNGVSRYHVTLSVRDGQVYLEDLASANGTYIDGLPVKGNEPRLLRGGEEIQIADVRLVFQPLVDLDITVKSSAILLDNEEIAVELDGPSMAVTPGAYTDATLSITNRRMDERVYSFQVNGLPNNWTRVDHRELMFKPGEQREIHINFKPRRHSQTRPGEYDFTIKITDAHDPNNTWELRSQLHVLKYSGYGVALATPVVKAGSPFQMYVHNQGNAPLAIDFRGDSPSGRLKFFITPPNLVLEAGQRQTVNGQISAYKRPWVGGITEQRFDIITRALDPSGFQAAISGKYLEKALFVPWMVVAGLGTMVIGVLIILLLAFVILPGDTPPEPTPTPTITPRPLQIIGFQVDRTEININEPLYVSWSTDQADLVSLSIQHPQLPETTIALPAQSGLSYELPMTSAGRYTLVLTAQEDDQSLSQELIVWVKPVINFSVSITDVSLPGDELVLYRNLEQTVELSWSVVWSVSASTDPREAPVAVLDSPVLGYTGQTVPLDNPVQRISLRPVLADSVSIRMTISGPDEGLQTVYETSIPIIEPVCNATLPATDLFEGPGERGYALLVSIPPQSLRLDSRTEDSAWLRVYMPPQSPIRRDFAWVRAQDVTCAIDLERLSSTTDYPPPSETPLPGFGATVSPTPSLPVLSPTPSSPTPTTTPPRQQG